MWARQAHLEPQCRVVHAESEYRARPPGGCQVFLLAALRMRWLHGIGDRVQHNPLQALMSAYFNGFEFSAQLGCP